MLKVRVLIFHTSCTFVEVRKSWMGNVDQRDITLASPAYKLCYYYRDRWSKCPTTLLWSYVEICRNSYTYKLYTNKWRIFKIVLM